MIRWGQVDVDNRLYIGVYKFMGEASSVSIRIDEKSHSSIGPVKAIWLLTTAGKNQTPSVIVASRFYRPNGRIFVYRDGESNCFEPNRVILSTRYFVWFDVNPVGSRPKAFVFSAIPADLID